MALPKTRQEFKRYCLRKLGDGIAQINITPEQIDDRVDEAIQRFTLHHYNASAPCYVYYEITQEDIDNNYIQLSDEVISVRNVLRNRSSTSVYSTDHLLTQNATGMIYGSGVDLVAYYVAQSHLSLIRNLFRADFRFNFNNITKQLTIGGDLYQAGTVSGGVIIDCVKRVNGEDLGDVDIPYFSKMWQEPWLQNYATCLMKIQWANNLRKFKDVKMLAGINLNVDDIEKSALEEFEKLEKQLLNEYSEPPDMFIG
jgi:hypothetical protein